jgi:RNA polymerase sigma factor (sigma-70 family)
MNFFRKNFNDQDLIVGIKEGGTRRRFFENNFYEKYLYLIKVALQKHQLDDEDASIVYSDTILTSIEHIASGRFEGRSELKTYVYQIFLNKCVDVIRKKTTKTAQTYQRVSIDDLIAPIPDTKKSVLVELITQQNHEQLYQFLAKLGERCQEILKRWSEGFTDEEISKQFEYSTAAVAQTTRLRCLEKLRGYYLNDK